MDTFWEFYKRLKKEAREEAAWARDNVVFVAFIVGVIALVTFFLTRHAPDWLGIQATFWVFGPLLLLYVPVIFYRAACRLHQKEQEKVAILEAYKKSVEDKEVHLEPSSPLCAVFVQLMGSEQCDCLRATFVNNRKPGIPGKVADKVAARITYTDRGREPFTLDGRWVRTRQPASFTPLDDKTEVLRVDFHPGTKHELDIVNKVPSENFFYGVAYDDLQARMLFGPVRVKIELIAVHVRQVHELFVEISEGKLVVLES
jgi:hypothetical protein